MVRKLKHHEQKLLRKVDFVSADSENNLREAQVMRRYNIQGREDYAKYNKLCGSIRKITTMLTKLDPRDPYRMKTTEDLITKVYNAGLITTKANLAACDKISVSAFCRRRLPIVLVRLKMSETVKGAVTLVEQGHVRIGPQTVTDPAFLVTRSMEDFVTWVDTSKIKRSILKYHDQVDDYDLL